MDRQTAFPDYPELYEQWFKENNHLFDAEVEAIRALFPASDAGKSIEIGVGTGLFAARLGIKNGVEPADKMRATAQARGIEVVDAVAEDLPEGDQTYHTALMVTVDCFLTDVDRAFKEARRILAPLCCSLVVKYSPCLHQSYSCQVTNSSGFFFILR